MNTIFILIVHLVSSCIYTYIYIHACIHIKEVCSYYSEMSCQITIELATYKLLCIAIGIYGN